MTEISFLIDLILNHKLPLATKNVIAARIKEVEAEVGNNFVNKLPRQSQSSNVSLPPQVAIQSASMQAIMAKNPDLINVSDDGTVNPVTYHPYSQPVTVVAQTPATQQALASRQKAINESLNGITDKTTGRPRKF